MNLSPLAADALALILSFLAWGVPYAALSAVQDSLTHAWGRSRWAKWFPDPEGYFGDAGLVWRRRYVDRDPARGYRPALRLAPLRALLVPFWDAWHLAKTGRYVLVSFLLCDLADVSSLFAPLVWIALGSVFERGYTWLRRRPLF